jgi:hypothetical protein
VRPQALVSNAAPPAAACSAARPPRRALRGAPSAARLCPHGVPPLDPTPRSPPPPTHTHIVIDGWLDLAKLVAADGSKSKGVYDELAFRIGGLVGGLGPAGGRGRGWGGGSSAPGNPRAARSSASHSRPSPLLPQPPRPPPPPPPGRDVYVDLAGWHLFLRDMSAVPGLKMASALAAQLGPAAADAGRGGLREADVTAVLKRIPVDVGGGRVTVRREGAARAERAAASLHLPPQLPILHTPVLFPPIGPLASSCRCTT